jgi:hypothetical protein
MTAAEDPHWAFAVPWLTPFGIQRLHDDYENRDTFAPDRTGGASAISRPDFAAGWVAAMARISQWSYFTAAGQKRFGP